MSEKAKWQKELDLFTTLTHTVMIDGNINDTLFDPISKVDKPLEKYLSDYLINEKHYDVVIFFNHVEGFYSYDRSDDTAYKAFFELYRHGLSQSTSISNVDGAGPQPGQGGCRGKRGLFGWMLDADDKTAEGPASFKFRRALENIRVVLRTKEKKVAIILTQVSRYIVAPDRIADEDQYVFSQLSLASSQMNDTDNLLMMVLDKANDIPVWFYLNNPNVRLITLPLPDNYTKEAFLRCRLDGSDEIEELGLDVEKVIAQINKHTVDFKLVEIDSFCRLVEVDEKLTFADIPTAISMYKYADDKNPWESQELLEKIQKNTFVEDIEKRVKGQRAAVVQAQNIISSAILGLAGLQHSSSSSKPRGIMFLAGPTGTGKTELAKSIAEWVFGSEERVIRFDMSEYSASHTDQRLLGAPPGYVGYEAGGELTKAVSNNPFSVLLFDEIEKANKSILDKFLQILEDGRITDGQGKTVYFSGTIIIFTSNLGTNRPGTMYGEDGSSIVIPADATPEQRETLEKEKAEALKNYNAAFNQAFVDYFDNEAGRPEIRNRIGQNFIIFRHIAPEIGELILQKMLGTIKNNLKMEKNIELKGLEVGDPAYNQLVEVITSGNTLNQGGRGIGNKVEVYVIRALSSFLIKNVDTTNDSVITIEGFVEEDENISLKATYVKN